MYRGDYAFGIGHYQLDVCHDSHSIFYKNKGTQSDATDDVIGPQPTVTLWVAPTSGRIYHLDKDCGKRCLDMAAVAACARHSDASGREFLWIETVV